MKWKISIFLILILCTGCSISDNTDKPYILKKLEDPFPENSMYPNINSNLHNQSFIISYIHTIGDTMDELMSASFVENRWNKPEPVASGAD